MVDFKELNGLDKAAILFKTLGTKLALQLFKGMDQSKVNKIRHHMKSISTIPFRVKKEVMEEFYFSYISDKLKPADQETKKPFDFLQKLTDEQVIYLIAEERPRIAGLTIAQLDIERQVSVLQGLDPAIQPEVLTEMGDLHDIPLEGVVSIANELKEKSHFLPKKSEFSRGGGKNLANILGKMRPRDEKRFMEHLEKEAPGVAKEIKNYHFTFDDLILLPKDYLSEILKSVESSDVAYSLKGKDDDLIDKFIDCLPQRTQIILEDEMDLFNSNK